jgi:hypothetical protein
VWAFHWLILTRSYPATSYSKAHPPRNSILFAKLRERVRATREGLVSSIWTRHPPTSWSIRRFLTSTGSSSTRSTTTIPLRWTPRSECASNSHHGPFCERYSRCCGSVAAREAGALVPAESGRKWKGVKTKRISPCAITGAIGYDTILPLFRGKYTRNPRLSYSIRETFVCLQCGYSI